MYRCECSGHPPRFFHSRATYYRHLKAQKSNPGNDSEAPPTDSTQLDMDNQEYQEDHSLCDGEGMLGDGESIISDGDQVMSNDESSDNDRGTTEETCSESSYTSANDVADESSDNSDDSDDSDGFLQGNAAIGTASPASEDTMSFEDLESGMLSSIAQV